MFHGFLPVFISKEERLTYYNALEEYAVNRNLLPFIVLIFELDEKQLDLYLKMEKFSI
jgi:hypothetical protein